MNDIEMILRSRIEELERRLLESLARVKELEGVHPDTERLDWLREWIREQGKRTDTCTYHILGQEICTDCRCSRMPNAMQGGAK